MTGRCLRPHALAAALLTAVAACAQQDGSSLRYLSPERRAEVAARAPYQRLYAPIYPAEETPRLMVLGDFDTPRSYMGEAWRHQGIDVVGRRGDLVIAVAPGEACVQHEQIHGLTVHLYPRLSKAAGTAGELKAVLAERSNGGKVETRAHRVRITYAHLQSTEGKSRSCRLVELGEPLGRIGTSGIANDPHLHFEIVARGPGELPGEPKLAGAINPFYLMRRAPDAPVGTITCFEEGMTYRPNEGAPPHALNIVWPTQAC